MAVSFPSAQSVFVPDHAATNKLTIDYARNVKSFALNQYCQIQPVKKVKGYYLVMTVEQAGRILSGDLANWVWADGQPAPEGNENLESFVFNPYECVRYAPSFMLGDQTVDQASWDIKAQYASITARAMMTGRTVLAITALTTTANFGSTYTGGSNHYSAVASISGVQGQWDLSTTARQDIKKSLVYASELIQDDTLAAIDLNELRLVINSTLAGDMATSQELVDHIKGSPEALAQFRGELPGSNTFYGLPDKVYGVPIVVEKTRKVTSKKGATTARSQVLPRTSAILLARPGGLVGVADAPSFSTCIVFAYQEMLVETLNDVNNKRVLGRVIDNIVPKIVAPASGFLFTAASSQS